MGFGGWWFLRRGAAAVSTLLLAWSWRSSDRRPIFAELRPWGCTSPQHPDRVGGPGVRRAFAVGIRLVNLALSSVIAGHIAHEILIMAPMSPRSRRSSS